mgnify:CR=1 FL=1
MPDTGRNPARDNDAEDAHLPGGKRHSGFGRDWLNHVPPGLADLPVDRPLALRECDIVTAPGTSPARFAAGVLAAAGLPGDRGDEARSFLCAGHGIGHRSDQAAGRTA